MRWPQAASPARLCPWNSYDTAMYNIPLCPLQAVKPLHEPLLSFASIAGSSASLRVGQEVLAIGNPHRGYEHRNASVYLGDGYVFWRLFPPCVLCTQKRTKATPCACGSLGGSSSQWPLSSIFSRIRIQQSPVPRSHVHLPGSPNVTGQPRWAVQGLADIVAHCYKDSSEKLLCKQQAVVGLTAYARRGPEGGFRVQGRVALCAIIIICRLLL